MKCILKLAACMAAGLLIVSCSHSSSSSKASASIPVARGVLEKGKVTAATCNVITLSDELIFSQATVKDGAYAANIPAEPFKIDCEVTAYINDKTGTPETKPIELLTFSSAGVDEKEKTLNINVLTTLVANQVNVAKKNNLNGMTAQSLEEAKTAAKEVIAKKYDITIGDIDTLSLKGQGVLAQVSLAVQTAMDGGKTFDKATDDLDKNQVQSQKGKLVNTNAMATPNGNLEPPAIAIPKIGTPTNDKGKPTAGKLTTLSGATIGTEDVTTNPTAVTATGGKIAFSLPSNLVTDLATTESMYLSGKAGVMPVLLQKYSGATSPYVDEDVSDLFDGVKPTTFTVCIVSDMIMDASDCSGATTKQTFTAILAHPTLGALTSATTLHGADVTQPITGLKGSNVLIFSLPASLVKNIGTNGVYITSDAPDAQILELPFKIDHYGGDNSRDNDDVGVLFAGVKMMTFTVCILPKIPTPKDCSGASKEAMQTFSQKLSVARGRTVILRDTTLGGAAVDLVQASVRVTTASIAADGKVLFSISIHGVTFLTNDALYISSEVGGPILVERHGDFYTADVISLFEKAGGETTFHVCISPKGHPKSDAECSGDRLGQSMLGKLQK